MMKLFEESDFSKVINIFKLILKIFRELLLLKFPNLLLLKVEHIAFTDI